MGLLRETAIVLGMGLALAGVLVASGKATPPPPRAEVCGDTATSSAAVHWMDLEVARTLQGAPGVLFVDARSEEEYQSGHISGAFHAPMDAGVVDDATIARLRGADRVVTYCDASDECARSMRLATLLVEAGFRDVHVLTGGFGAWTAAGLPSEAGTCRSCE